MKKRRAIYFIISLAMFMTMIQHANVSAATVSYSKGIAFGPVAGKTSDADIKSAINSRNSGIKIQSNYCTKYVYDKLAKMGCTLKTYGNGTQWYNGLNNGSYLPSGYSAECVSGNDALQTLVNRYNGKALYNVVVSFGTHRDTKDAYRSCGHVMMIDCIKDGKVYYTDSYKHSNIAAGSIHVSTIAQFKSFYLSTSYWGYTCMNGAALITKNASLPVISNAKITNVTSTGATIECDATAANGLQYVKCTVWNVAQGIDKYQWIATPSSVNGNHYTFKFNVSSFGNRTGDYKVNIHAWDKQEVKTMISSPLVFTIPAHTHNWVTVKAKAATCTTAGNTEYKKCSGCGETTVANGGYIAPKGHQSVTDAAVKATCTTAGKTEGKHCSACGVVLVKQNIIPAKGHSYGEWVNNNKNTETHIHKCANCGETEEKVHIWSAGENNGNGVINYTCKECSAIKTEKVFEMNDDSDVEQDSEKKTEAKDLNKKTSKKVTLKSAKAGKKTIKLSWKTIKGVDGYEVQYSTNKKFAKSKTKRCFGNSIKISKLKSSKKYYVRVRLYYYDEQMDIHYGDWSKTKSVLIK